VPRGDFAPMRSNNAERTLRPLWVKSRHLRRSKSCPLCPRKRTCAAQLGMSALGQALHRVSSVSCEVSAIAVCLQETAIPDCWAIRWYTVPIPSGCGFLPAYNRAIAINHLMLPPTRMGRRRMRVVTKRMVGSAALIVSALAVAQFIPTSPVATDQNFFQAGTKADDFDALRRRARDALQTLIEKQQSNEQQRS